MVSLVKMLAGCLHLRDLLGPRGRCLVVVLAAWGCSESHLPGSVDGGAQSPLDQWVRTPDSAGNDRGMEDSSRCGPGYVVVDDGCVGVRICVPGEEFELIGTINAFSPVYEKFT